MFWISFQSHGEGNWLPWESGWSQELVSAESAHGWGLHHCICNIQWVCVQWDQVISNLSAPSCFWVTQNQQRWQNSAYFWTNLCFLWHEFPSGPACLSCLNCEYFAAAADEPGEREDPAAASLIPLPSGFVPFLAYMAKCWAE